MDETSRNLLFLALSLLVIVIVYELYKLKALKKQKNKISEVFLSKKAHLLTHCQSPDCYRCTNNRDLLQAAITKLSYYSLGNDSSGAADNVQNLSKDIRKSLDRLKYPDEGVTADQSLTSGSTKSKTSSPVVFKMSGLREQELWSQSDFPALQILDTYFNQIQIEFTNLYKSPLTETLCLWKTNSTSSGKWEIAQLIDQGRKTKAAEFCPLTMEALSKVPYFIRGNAFGDASFSVVHPGTHIATHCGSTNCRIRCHLGKFISRTVWKKVTK